MLNRVLGKGAMGADQTHNEPPHDRDFRSQSICALLSSAWPVVSAVVHVPARNNTGMLDTSCNPHLDENGDGFDDVVVGADYADPRGRMDAGTASIYQGARRA